MFTTVIGLMAAFCTTVSYYPQLQKCWATGSAGDLSLKMFLTLAAGVALWVVYGLAQFMPATARLRRLETHSVLGPQTCRCDLLRVCA